MSLMGIIIAIIWWFCEIQFQRHAYAT